MSLILLLSGTLAACRQQGPRTTPWYKIKDPSIEVVSVNLTRQTDQGARIEVTARLENPNDVALPLKDYHLTFDLADGPAVTFRDLANRTLPSEGSQLVTMPLAIAVPGQSLVGDGYHVSGWMHYEPPGEIRKLLTDSSIPLPSSSFSTRGELKSSPPSVEPPASGAGPEAPGSPRPAASPKS